MKICRYRTDGELRLGIHLDSEIVDPLRAGGPENLFGDVRALICGGRDALNEAKRLVDQAPAAARINAAEATLGPPILPSTVLCAGSNYHAHNAEKASSPTSGKEPEFFIKTADCVIGPNDAIVHDRQLTSKLDCETELAIVIGRPGRHIPVADALSHVFGYTIANDVTARDRQVRRTPEGVTWYDLGWGKAFDTSLPLGPVITPAEAIADPQALRLETRINGELRQSTSTSDMIWSCADLVHFFSVSFTLRPGMVILTGTPAGTAWSVDKELGGTWHPAGDLVPATRYCAPGDVIESTIEKIGTLRNTVVGDGG